MRLRVSTGPHVLSSDSTQKRMLDVVIALAPVSIVGVYLFGLHALFILLIATAAAVAAEAVWQRLTGSTVTISDLSAVVTGLLVGLNMPASAPLWLPVVGSLFAVIVVKQVFGGIGHNFLNPALAARAVLLTSWPARMTTFFLPQRLLLDSVAPIGDAVTSATPLVKSGTALMDLFLGNIPGSIGEVCKVAILLGFVYLLIRGTISFEITTFFVGTVALMTWLVGGDPLVAILSGGVLFGAVFMATDYVTRPMLKVGQYIYAIGAGVIVVLIRKYGGYPEGVTYAILLMNVITPLLDKFIKRRIYGEVKQHA